MGPRTFTLEAEPGRRGFPGGIFFFFFFFLGFCKLEGKAGRRGGGKRRGMLGLYEISRHMNWGYSNLWGRWWGVAGRGGGRSFFFFFSTVWGLGVEGGSSVEIGRTSSF